MSRFRAGLKWEEVGRGDRHPCRVAVSRVMEIKTFLLNSLCGVPSDWRLSYQLLCYNLLFLGETFLHGFF